MATTPMMQQYESAKKTCGDAILLFRMGDFYELFYEDAKRAAAELGLTLTSRDKGENPIPMAGFPHHQLDGYLGKLIRAGYRAAVCEQVEDPKKAKGIVKREVTRVVSPGTLTDDNLLDPRASNYLAAIAPSAERKGAPPRLGLAWAELSTGRFLSTSIAPEQLADHLARIAPSEVLLPDDESGLALRDQILQGMTTTRPAWSFALKSAEKQLNQQFGTASLDGFGFRTDDGPAIRAAGAILDYLAETQKGSLDHFDGLRPYRVGQSLELDEATRRSLELTRTIRENRRDGSLLSVIDRCVTSMGSRWLSDWLSSPSTDLETINNRLDAVEELVKRPVDREQLRSKLKDVYDLERLLARVTTGRATPRDLACIGQTLGLLPRIAETLERFEAGLLKSLAQEFDACPQLAELLQAALLDEAPLLAREGGFVREGYSSRLDELRELAVGGKQWIAQYQAAESERLDVPLKVGYNRVFGYYIEVTHTHRDKLPDTYIRKQTLKNAERFITPELKEYEEKVLAADDQAKELEYEIFQQLRQQVHDAAGAIQKTAHVISQLDVLAGLADLAQRQNYCRPELVEDHVLQIEEGRHPVLDILEPQGTFVPNDACAAPDEGLILLITGPNMAGKSTYIRQVALLTILAQMGSFVPARKAIIGVADRVFARVGASDELSRGQSTFMVEMTETARILNTATPRSLVILDEIGRGTSTYDGLSLAWAIVEYLHDHVGARTFFATHYHELTDLEESLPGVANLNVAVKEWDEQVVFLHKIVPGAADKSYGIHVARLAGVPQVVNERAKQVLNLLESEHLDEQGKPRIARKQRRGDVQLTLFAPYDHPLLDEVRNVRLDSMTPLQAMTLIEQWQKSLANEKSSD